MTFRFFLNDELIRSILVTSILLFSANLAFAYDTEANIRSRNHSICGLGNLQTIPDATYAMNACSASELNQIFLVNSEMQQAHERFLQEIAEKEHELASSPESLNTSLSLGKSLFRDADGLISAITEIGGLSMLAAGLFESLFPLEFMGKAPVIAKAKVVAFRSLGGILLAIGEFSLYQTLKDLDESALEEASLDVKVMVTREELAKIKAETETRRRQLEARQTVINYMIRLKQLAESD